MKIAVTFDPTKLVSAYNVEDGVSVPGAFLQYVTFKIDVTRLSAGYAVHFDLYGKELGNNGKSKDSFAPFSHDAQSGNRVPDGGTTVGLLGLGLIGLVAFVRKTKLV